MANATRVFGVIVKPGDVTNASMWSKYWIRLFSESAVSGQDQVQTTTRALSLVARYLMEDSNVLLQQD